MRRIGKAGSALLSFLPVRACRAFERLGVGGSLAGGFGVVAFPDRDSSFSACDPCLPDRNE